MFNSICDHDLNGNDRYELIQSFVVECNSQIRKTGRSTWYSIAREEEEGDIVALLVHRRHGKSEFEQ